VLTAGLLVVVAGLASVVAGLGQVVLARHRAEAAADLAALAGAGILLDPFADADPCARAARVATANAAALTTCRSDADGSLTVVVAVPLSGVLARAGPATSTARAGPP